MNKIKKTMAATAIAVLCTIAGNISAETVTVANITTGGVDVEFVLQRGVKNEVRGADAGETISYDTQGGTLKGIVVIPRNFPQNRTAKASQGDSYFLIEEAEESNLPSKITALEPYRKMLFEEYVERAQRMLALKHRTPEEVERDRQEHCIALGLNADCER